jgi:hypothetical protein
LEVALPPNALILLFYTDHTEIRKTQRVGREMVIITVMAGEGGGWSSMETVSMTTKKVSFTTLV